MSNVSTVVPKIVTYPHTFHYPTTTVVDMAVFEELKGGHKTGVSVTAAKDSSPKIGRQTVQSPANSLPSVSSTML